MARALLHEAYFHRESLSPAQRLYGRLFGFPLATDWLRSKKVEACLPASLGAVLDVGCGNGLMLFALASRHPDLRARAIDRNATAIAHDRDVARKLSLANLEFEAGDWRQLTEGHGGRYDTVFLMDVLTEVDDQQGLLRRIHDVLRPGGCLVLGNAMPSPLRGLVDAVDPYWQDPRLHAAVRRLDLMGLLGDAGFRVEKTARLAGLPFGVPAHCVDILFFKSRGLKQLVHAALFPVLKAMVAAEMLLPPLWPTGIVVRARRS